MAPRPILQASFHSKILIAGQAPGIVTHEKGIPFDDKSGERLRGWLGVDRNQFYDAELFAIVPMAFCYPGKGNSGDLPPPAICAQTWRKKLLAQLPNIELTLILGKYAANWHLHTNSSISALASNWKQNLAGNYMVLPHPSPRNNRWLKNNIWFEQEAVPSLQKTISKIIESSDLK
ncbi:uracil-DNA glycosylase family protein [Thalassotalea fusca]